MTFLKVKIKRNFPDLSMCLSGILMGRTRLGGAETAKVRQDCSPGSVGAFERAHHMHSNSSMRCLVFPDRICRRVLYLSRPAFMFSAWIMSFTVFLVSSRALANSELKAWKHSQRDSSQFIPFTALSEQI